MKTILILTATLLIACAGAQAERIRDAQPDPLSEPVTDFMGPLSVEQPAVLIEDCRSEKFDWEKEEAAK